MNYRAGYLSSLIFCQLASERGKCVCVGWLGALRFEAIRNCHRLTIWSRPPSIAGCFPMAMGHALPGTFGNRAANLGVMANEDTLVPSRSCYSARTHQWLCRRDFH